MFLNLFSFVLIPFVALTEPQLTTPLSLPLALDRMGAGISAGWGLKSDHTLWEISQTQGPLGPGAARLNFSERGEARMESPVFRLEADRGYTFTWWARADAPGARVRCTVRDNVSRDAVAFGQDIDLTQDWTNTRLQEVVPRSKSGNYYLEFTVYSEAGVVEVDGLWFGVAPESIPADWQPERKPVSVRLWPEAPWGVVSGDEAMRFTATVAGATQPGSVLSLRAVHVTGLEEQLPSIPLDADGAWDQTISVEGATGGLFGMTRVVATVVGADGTPLSRSDETLLSRAPEPVPGPAPESPFGIHVSLRDPDLGAAAKLGYKWCRLHDASGISKWGLIEPEPGQWIWHDDAVDLARTHGFSIMGMLDSAPLWASGNPITEGYWHIYHAPHDYEAWRNYVRQIVGHYAGRIDTWEVWNEPWNMNAAGFFAGGNPWKYAGLLKSAYQEAKATNPDATIVGINTSPAIWDQVVLALDTLPYMDQLSFHRYDAAMPGPETDGIGLLTERLYKEQSKHGAPKPLMATEGGPDLFAYHGSFYSFANPEITGDWSALCDQYVRTYLRYIASGVTKFFAYSIHNEPPHHGHPTCMMVEPGYLPSPVHLALAGFAKQVEGMRYARCLAPAPDISAHVFRSPEGAAEARTVVVLVGDGAGAEELPRALPEGIGCFDRWGNPIHLPTRAERSPVYLVAIGEEQDALLKSLEGNVDDADGDTPALLTQRTIQSLTSGTPPLWTQFSAEGNVFVETRLGMARALRRDALKSKDSAALFRLPAGVRVAEERWTDTVSGRIGEVTLEAQGAQWSLTGVAVPDGPGGIWRYRTLALIAEMPGMEDASAAVETAMRVWEQSMTAGEFDALADALHPEVFWSSFTTTLLGNLLWQERELQVSTLRVASEWGKATRSKMENLIIHTDGHVATCTGRWRLEGTFYEKQPMPFCATLVNENNAWVMTGFFAAPEVQPARPWYESLLP